MTPVLVFDIETIPDVSGLRRLGNIDPGVSDEEVAARAFAERLEKTGREFLPLHLQRVIAIACLMRDDDGLRVRALGGPEDGEGKLVTDFFRIIERYVPQLVSWNGSGFDLPVLHYRALFHGVTAARYWEQGEDDRDFRYNNYLSRYHARHLDLMDVLSGYQGRATAPLDEIARLCGFAGKLGMDGSQVWPAYCAGHIEAIRQYCETDVLNTWLVYCRFQQLRGMLTPAAFDAELELARTSLTALPGKHWQEYLESWP